MAARKKQTLVEHKLSNISFISPADGVNFRWCYQNATSMHDHDFYEFVLILDGKSKHFHNSKTCVASKKMLFLIKPGEYHQFSPHHNHEAKHVNFSITPAMLQKLSSIIWQEDVLQKLNLWELPSNLTLSDKDFNFILDTLEQLNQCSLQSKNFYALVKNILLRLMIFLVGQLETHEQLSSADARPEWLNEFLKTLNDPNVFTMKLRDIYPLAPYSQSMLNSYFKKYVGSTLVAYISTLKISYACTLLRHTDSSPLEISNKLAYDSLSHFNRLFKKTTGLSPIAYRKRITPNP